MENTFRVYLRLFSDTVDFKDLIPEIADYELNYLKKGETLNKKRTRKAFANILISSDETYVCNELNEVSNVAIIDRLSPLITALGVIEIADLQRELWISGQIQYDYRPRFWLSSNLVKLMAKNNYAISFSGIWWGEE
jgi:hypothetical protein